MDDSEINNETSCNEEINANETRNDEVEQSPKRTNEEEERNSNSSDDETKSKERTKPRVPSALTVENVKKHEEETDAIDVVELMTKNALNNKEEGHLSSGNEEELSTGSSAKIEEEIDISSSEQNPNPPSEKQPVDDKEDDHNPSKTEADLEREAEKLLSDAWNQPKRQTMQPVTESPAYREEVRGIKYTGEEYLAISIDVQTDESWIAEIFEWPQDNLDRDIAPFASRPTFAVASTDGSQLNGRRHRNVTSSDLSSSEMQEPNADAATAESLQKASARHESFLADSDAEDENPIIELTDSEFGGSQAYTYTTDRTIPSVGPPYILQYKAETKMAQIDYDEVQVTIPEDVKWENLSPRQQEYYENLKREMKRISQEKIASKHPEKELINIEPHSAYGSKRERKLAKERAAERSRMREMEKQTKQGGGQMVTNQTNFYAFARQLKTVNYSLSSEKCMEEGWTIRPLTPPTPEEKAKEFFVHDPNSDIISGKRFVRRFVQRFYPHGEIFLTVFPDGTGNVWYPSGNVAVSILASEKIGKLIFILHEDVAYEEGPDIQALFEPNGYCTCYYPSGGIRLMLTPFGGEYFSSQGARLKKWIWKDMQTHVHAPPFQPITFALSRKVGVRVISQESIYITFTDGRRSVRFNAGTRLRPNPMHLLPKLEQVDADRVLLEEKRAQIQMIIERITVSTMFPNSPRLKKLQLSSYLTSQLDKTAKLRAQLLEQQLIGPPESKRKTKKPSPGRRSLAQSFSAPETNRIVMKEKPKAKTSQRNLHRKQKQFDDKESDMQPVVIVN